MEKGAAASWPVHTHTDIHRANARYGMPTRLWAKLLGSKRFGEVSKDNGPVGKDLRRSQNNRVCESDHSTPLLSRVLELQEREKKQEARRDRDIQRDALKEQSQKPYASFFSPSCTPIHSLTATGLKDSEGQFGGRVGVVVPLLSLPGYFRRYLTGGWLSLSAHPAGFQHRV